MKLTTYTQVAAALGEQAAADISERYNQLADTRRHLGENMHELEKRTNHFINQGWADLRLWSSLPIRPFRQVYGHICWDWHQYFRRLAKDMERPYIRVLRYYPPLSQPQLNIQLCIPRRKSLLPLSASLLLIDGAGMHDTVTWRWRLSEELFAAWCVKLRTDDDMRRCIFAHSAIP